MSNLADKLAIGYFTVWILGGTYIGYKSARFTKSASCNDPYQLARAGLNGAVTGAIIAIPLSLFPPCWCDVGKAVVKTYNGEYN